TLLLEARRHRGDRLLAISRASGEDDRIDIRGAVAEPESIGVNRAGRAAADIDRDGGALGETDNGNAGRPRLVRADADLERRPVEGQGRPVGRRGDRELALIGRDGRGATENEGGGGEQPRERGKTRRHSLHLSPRSIRRRL